MAFQHPDIQRFLIDSIPGRFAHLTPEEFESFMAHLFTLDGYEVEPITKKGDNATTLLAKRDGVSLVLRILRLTQSHPAGEEEVQKALAAKTYYETEQSWLITTSSFSKQAIKSAEANDVEYWDWDALNQALSDLFFQGKSNLEIATTTLPEVGVQTAAELKLKVKWKPEEGIGSEWYNLDLTISNPTRESMYVHLDLPALIDNKKNQITAEKWADEEFVSGIIYEGASVRTNALFKASRIGERPPGGKVMLTCHVRTDAPSVSHLSARLKGDACYFVTYCYSRQSPEYVLMIKFRDDILSAVWYGRMCVNLYYFISPMLVRWASKIKFIDITVRRLSFFAIQHVRRYYSK